MKTVYVAGAMNGSNILEVLGNISRGIKVGRELLKLGYAPFVPHLDIMFKLQGGDDFDLDMQTYYDYTMEFLKRCDAIVVCEKSENSIGTLEEIKMAKELGIPIYESANWLKCCDNVEHIITGENK